MMTENPNKIDGKIERLRTVQLFQFLLAVKNKQLPIIRDVTTYGDKIYWEKELPLGKGCWINGNGNEGDAWLEVHKQDIPKGPKIPAALDNWVDRYNPDNPTLNPIFHDSISIQGTIIFIKDKSNIQEIKNRWIDEQWKPWAQKYTEPFKVQSLYNDLFFIYQRLQQEDDLEISWGNGLLMWETQGHKIRRHLFTTRLLLNFDAKKGIFKLLPADIGTSMETDMLSSINIPNLNKLLSFERIFLEKNGDPRRADVMMGLFNSILNYISTSGNVLYEQTYGKPSQFTSSPQILNSPALFLRKGYARLWQKDLENIVNAVKEGVEIPKHVIDLVSVKYKEPDLNEKIEWEKVGSNLLFPLPSNEEQREIAVKLARHYGVVVQGPPGTGKSHTIANLICHLLSHGKRVLVASQTEKALRVLQNKIPPSIRPLCISLLDGGKESSSELEYSVNEISAMITTSDKSILEDEIKTLEEELYYTKRKIAENTNFLKEAARFENEKIPFRGNEYTPARLWAWVEENEKHFNWLQDDIRMNTEIPLNKNEIIELYRLSGSLSAENRNHLKFILPEISKLPLTSQLEEHFLTLKDFNDKISNFLPYIEKWSIPSDLKIDFEETIAFVEQSLVRITNFRESWLNQVFNEISYGGNRRETWKSFYYNCKALLNEISKYNRELSSHAIKISKNISIEDFEKVYQQFEKGDNISLLFKIFESKAYNAFKECSLDGKSINCLNDVAILKKHFDRETARNKILTLWQNIIIPFKGPSLNPQDLASLGKVEEIVDNLYLAINWSEISKTPILHKLQGISFNQEVDWSSVEWLKTLLKGLRALELKKKYSTEKMKEEVWIKYLQSGGLQDKSHILWHELLDAIKGKKIDLWKRSVELLHRLSSLKPDYDKFILLFERLQSVAPKWAKNIWECSGNPPEDYKEAWEWAQARTSRDIHLRINIDKNQEELEQNLCEERSIIGEIVAKKTRLSQIERTTEEQKRALNSWIQFVRKVGKGKGKYAERHMKSAMEQMVTCKDAVPVWIMPIQRVIENFRPDGQKFDVIILDESSQSDIFALSALFRAKRAIIVGDDQQISPQGVGIEQSEIHQLAEQYLTDIPQKKIYDSQTSIYDLAKIVFPGTIMLKEHFRCIPDIIEFNNNLMYNGQIIPLRRVPTDYPMLPSIRPIFIKDGFIDKLNKINEPEAEAIVSQIKEICQKPSFNNKTIGVISLLGKDQALLIQKMLINEIGIMEMLQRRILCGDAYSFQGDERDIIFLSMVSGNNEKVAPLTKRSDYQRFNVASSRAKDQVWLFHSVNKEDLNPQCVRRLLMEHYLAPKEKTLELRRLDNVFESPFERDVFKVIISKGYKVEPQVKVGRYRIDLVVNGQLAVECDGDQWHGPEHWEKDMERQNILERAGWPFWRIRASVFYRDRNKAMESLWKKLDEMNVKTE